VDLAASSEPRNSGDDPRILEKVSFVALLSKRATRTPAKTDRTDALLAELVDFQKLQVHNQELMMARQEQALFRQQEAIRRQRKVNRSLWILTCILIAMMMVVSALNFLARVGH
jgi:hypothetical protein